mmetsp:Transcript_124799/g.364500  ORF Transcript_124799/g.364500 Transcript_124799/m.364500 type:complete len:205 (+) Transcript_124799:319-933(+)
MEDRPEVEGLLPGVVLPEDKHLIRSHVGEVVPALRLAEDYPLVHALHVLPDVGCVRAVPENNVLRAHGLHVAHHQRHHGHVPVRIRASPEVEALEVTGVRHQEAGEVLLDRRGHVRVDAHAVDASAAVGRGLGPLGMASRKPAKAIPVLVATAPHLLAACDRLHHCSALLVVVLLHCAIVQQVNFRRSPDELEAIFMQGWWWIK